MIPVTTAASFSLETESNFHEWRVTSKTCPVNPGGLVMLCHNIAFFAQYAGTCASLASIPPCFRRRIRGDSAKNCRQHLAARHLERLGCVK